MVVLFLASSSGSMLTVLLGTMGAVFTVANWIPYALIMQEAASMRELYSQQELQPGAAGLLSVHNAAICLPQIFAAGVASLFFLITEEYGIMSDVSWVFVGSIGPAVAAAYLTRPGNT